MTKENMLMDYMTRFRLQCHYRLDMVPGDIKELPIFMYKAAQESVRLDMINELNLNEDDVNVIRVLEEAFINKLIEIDHFTKADDLIEMQIKSGQFTK